jgi:hypothetical protein
MDLAHKGRGTHWQVEDNFKEVLRDLGARNDIIQQLYSSLGNEAGRVERVNAGATPSAPVAGVVITKGSPDEIGEDRFVVVRDGAGHPHYGRVRDGEDYRDLRAGSIAELGAGTDRRRQVAEQIAAVAKANAGVYSEQLHEAIVRTSKPSSTDRQIASLVRSATSRLGFVAGHEGSGVRPLADGHYAVEPEVFQKFSERGSQRTDVRAIASHAVSEQVEAHAVTWLDRQAFGDHPDTRLRDHPAVQEAIQQRQEWLVQHGYADRTQKDGRVVLRANALHKLAAEERSDTVERLEQKYKQPIEELSAGGAVTGEYRGTQQLHGGKLAIVITEDAVVVAPVGKTPDVATGSTVNLERTTGRNAMVTSVAGKSLDQQTGRAIDGLEAGR